MTPDTPADGEGGWADVQHTDPFFSLPTQNPASGALAEAIAEAVAYVRQAEPVDEPWRASTFGHGPLPNAIATILNAVLSGALIPRPAVPAQAAQVGTFYIDCEFDGHAGPLLSIAMVRGDGRGLHVKVSDLVVEDPWVAENVLPIMDSHHADYSWNALPNEVGTFLRGFIGACQNPTIIADSPVDIARFCRAISTGEDGGWHSTGYEGMTFIVRNVDCYPTALTGAVQHNAWWDAMALRAALQHKDATHGPE